MVQNIIHLFPQQTHSKQTDRRVSLSHLLSSPYPPPEAAVVSRRQVVGTAVAAAAASSPQFEGYAQLVFAVKIVIVIVIARYYFEVTKPESETVVVVQVAWRDWRWYRIVVVASVVVGVVSLSSTAFRKLDVVGLLEDELACGGTWGMAGQVVVGGTHPFRMRTLEFLVWSHLVQDYVSYAQAHEV